MESLETSSLQLLKRMNVGHRLSLQFEAAMESINGDEIERKMAAMQHRISRIHSRFESVERYRATQDIARGELDIAQSVHCLWSDSLALRARAARGQRAPLRFAHLLRCIAFYFVSNIRNMVDCFHDVNDGLADALCDAYW